MSKAVPSMRIDRLLANMGYGSRRDVERMVKAGHVVLDGAPLKAADQRLQLASDLSQRMRIWSEPLDPLPGLLLMLHKPAGVTCSHKEAGPLVYSLLPDRWRRREPAISSVGRLDKDTSGLLLLTDDGAMLHRIISPKSNIAKRYLAQLARPLQGHEAELFSSGTLMLEGEDKPLALALFVPLTQTTCNLTVTEGRYHQVRRMLAAAGNHVEALHRDRVGGLDLPDNLAPGDWRLLGAQDVERIFGAAA